MAQSFEYPMWSPHPKAKLYKRYTADMPVELKDGESVTVQGNRYVCVCKIRWVEATERTENEYQPMDGLLTPNGYLTIRTNSLHKFEKGDLVVIEGKLWQVDGDVRIGYIYTPKKVQTNQYLELRKVL